ncbi:hypothetical protein NGUA38_01255 [Salmonella enterica]|nr:hypothetical protein NGUA38_01255 [Salmonella enterica]
MPAADVEFGDRAAGVHFQHGVVGDVAGTQRLNVAGDQRAAADKGAAGISIAAGKRERVVAGFFHTARTADVVDEVTAGVQLQHGVVGDVACTQRLNVAGDQRAATDDGAASVSIAAGKRERVVAGFDHPAAAADGVVERAAGVQLQSGVVGDVATPQRLNVSGDQRAAADGGAAGIGVFRIQDQRACALFDQRCAVPAGGAGGIERGVNVFQHRVDRKTAVGIGQVKRAVGVGDGVVAVGIPCQGGGQFVLLARVINAAIDGDKVGQIGVHSGDGKLFEIARNGFI